MANYVFISHALFVLGNYFENQFYGITPVDLIIYKSQHCLPNKGAFSRLKRRSESKFRRNEFYLNDNDQQASFV